jgi:endonuclease G
LRRVANAHHVRAQYAKLPAADEAPPSGYWRNIAVPAPQGSAAPIRVPAFIFDQETPGRKPAAGNAVSVRDADQRAGLDFSRTLPDDVEDRVEGTVDGALVQVLLGK